MLQQNGQALGLLQQIIDAIRRPSPTTEVR
jgi:hypothetical protein